MIPSIVLNDDRSEKVCYNTPDYPVYIRRGLLSRYPDYKAPTTGTTTWNSSASFPGA